jgi:hypothetical protein
MEVYYYLRYHYLRNSYYLIFLHNSTEPLSLQCNFLNIIEIVNKRLCLTTMYYRIAREAGPINALKSQCIQYDNLESQV